MELETMTALELVAKIKQRQIHVVDGVKAVFDQIESKEETVHAYLDLYKKEAYARAKEVEAAFKAEMEAHNKYIELRNKFIKDYGSFHMSYTTPTPLVKGDYSSEEAWDIINSLFQF